VVIRSAKQVHDNAFGTTKNNAANNDSDKDIDPIVQYPVRNGFYFAKVFHKTNRRVSPPRCSLSDRVTRQHTSLGV